jgi:predicted nucleic-acid-binding protein
MIRIGYQVLAPYYIEDEGDLESRKQRDAACRIIEAGTPLMVCKTVLLEFEWIMRGYYGFARKEVTVVFQHLYALPHVTFENRVTAERALRHYLDGFDFADALHHASYSQCTSMATFDDKGLARRAKKFGLSPGISIPK